VSSTTGPSAETHCAAEASVAAGLEGYYELAGAEEIGAAAEITVRLAVCNHTARQRGFDGSASAKLTGPIPQIAMTAGSFWPRITPS
jgi:hypothetical protein